MKRLTLFLLLIMACLQAKAGNVPTINMFFFKKQNVVCFYIVSQMGVGLSCLPGQTLFNWPPLPLKQGLNK